MIWKIRNIHTKNIVDVIEITDVISEMSILQRWLAWQGLPFGQITNYQAEGVMKVTSKGKNVLTTRPIEVLGKVLIPAGSEGKITNLGENGKFIHFLDVPVQIVNPVFINNDYLKPPSEG